MQARTIATTDPLWNEILAICDHDFYHLPEYVELEARRIGGQGLGIVVQEDDQSALFPLVARDLPEEYREVASGIRDATSPYGYPCPVFSKGSEKNTSFVKSSFGELLKTMRETSIVSAFFRPHPLITFDRMDIESLGIVTIDHGSTAWIDLKKPIGEILKDTRPTHRNLISRARREGFVAREDTGLEHLETFGRIYRETMARLDADSMYMFGDDYFQKLAEALGDKLHLWLVESDGEVAAAGLFPACNGIVQYHLSGTEKGFEKVSPTRLMISEVRDWAIDRGDRVFHLGGGLGSREDGLYIFKAGFSRSRAVFRTMRIVASPEKYDILSAKLSSDEKARNGFFPAYRAPR